MLDQSYYDKTDEIIAEHGSDQASLIPIIQDIQTEYRYLPPELLKRHGLSCAQIHPHP